MIFDELGLPKENGASDLQDSARLAGVMTTFNYPKVVPMENYVEFKNTPFTKYVRHPLEYRYDFSRDQALCLMAGLFYQRQHKLVDLKYVIGKDWFFPSHRGHVKRCQGKKSNWIEDLWLEAEIYFNAKFTPLAEPNQLLCMMMVAGNGYVNLWVKNNPQWRKAITNYWSYWRNEPELAGHMIRKIESVCDL